MILFGGLEAVPAEQLKWTLVILMTLAILALQVWLAVRSRRTQITPDPLRIEKLDKFATRDFCEMKNAELSRRLEANEEDIRRIYVEMKRDRAAADVHASERSKTIFNEIKLVRAEVTDKIDGMPDRIIKLLSELGLLRKP
jgi:hypothetical protein